MGVSRLRRPMPSILVLVRHGESAWNAEGRLQGQADPSLSEAGRKQARAVRDHVPALGPFDAVICSDLARARETAECAGVAVDRYDPQWREIEIGVWTALLDTEVPPEELAAWRHGDWAPDGGETWEDFQARVAVAATALGEGTFLVVTHGGCIRALVAHVTGAPAHTIAGSANCAISVVELGERPRLLAYNRAEGRIHPSDPGGAAPKRP